MKGLSICIPVHNQLISGLLASLLQSANPCGIDFEILPADDGSDKKIRESNLRETPQDNHIHWILSDENKGRSATRNLLAQAARYDWLLFLDCDVSLVNQNFISNYLKYFQQADILVGGYLYHPEKPAPEFRLRYTYGQAREARPAAIRQRHPLKAFSSFNFCIRRELMHQCPFDEQFKDYGHEDTLFGKALEAFSPHILHIDNPLYHEGLDNNNNAHYLANSRQAVEKFIYSPAFQDKEVIASIRILKTYYRVKSLCMNGLLACCYRKAHVAMEKQLCGKKPLMKLFDMYRLCYLCAFAEDYAVAPKTNTLSVIIPVYNRAHCLEICLQSVYQQTFRPIELILVDNASTDDSLDVCYRFQQQCHQDDFIIKVLEEPKRGACAARNTGLRAATGNYIHFFDSDDVMYPFLYDTVFRTVNSQGNPDMVALYSDLDLNGELSRRPKHFASEAAEQLYDPILTTPTCVIRHDYLCRLNADCSDGGKEDQNGGWNEALSRWQDLEFGFRLLLPEHRLVWIKKSLYRVIYSDDSISGASYIKDYPALKKALETLRQDIALRPQHEQPVLYRALAHKMVATAALLYREARQTQNKTRQTQDDSRQTPKEVRKSSVPCHELFQEALSLPYTKKKRSLLRLHFCYAKHGGRGFWRIARLLSK